jgi:hypothetical protein
MCREFSIATFEYQRVDLRWTHDKHGFCNSSLQPVERTSPWLTDPPACELGLQQSGCVYRFCVHWGQFISGCMLTANGICGFKKRWSLIRERYIAIYFCILQMVLAVQEHRNHKCSHRLPSLAASGSLFWCLSHAWLGCGACPGGTYVNLWVCLANSSRSRNIVATNSPMVLHDLGWIFMDVSTSTLLG